MLWNGPPFSNGEPGVKLGNISCTSAKFSEDGSRLMVMKSDSVISVYDCSSYREIRSFQIPNVVAAALSPRGTFLQTFQKSSTPQDKNVVLWSTETGDPVYQQLQKTMAKATWYDRTHNIQCLKFHVPELGMYFDCKTNIPCCFAGLQLGSAQMKLLHVDWQLMRYNFLMLGISLKVL